jgi:ribosome maturation factor RimP
MTNGAQTFADRVAETATPVLRQAGYDLILAEFVPQPGTLRLYIDREDGVTVDSCADVSRLVSDLIDGRGLDADIPHYQLEVSSPGLDRPLVRPKDFQRFIGHRIKVTTREAIAGRRRFTGTLETADEQGISVECDGTPYALAYSVIERARLVPKD